MQDLKPHDHQAKNIDKIRDWFRKGVLSVLWYLPTGGGKSFAAGFMLLTASVAGKRCWFVVHRRELLRQTMRLFKILGIDFGVIAAGFEEQPAKLVQICSINTLARRIDRLQKPQLLIQDECFRGDVMVDGRTISSYIVGDMVRSFSHRVSRVQLRRITRVFVSRPTSLLSVVTSSGQHYVCTHNHPFHIGGRGYVDAKELSSGDILTSMHGMRQSLPAGYLSQAISVAKNWANLLRNRVFEIVSRENIVGDDGAYEQTICIGANDGQKPDAIFGKSRQDVGDIEAYKAHAKNTWWKWEGNDCTSIYFERRYRRSFPDCGARSKDWCSARLWITESLQARFGHPVSDDSNRGGRGVPLFAHSASARLEEAEFSDCKRVESIEIHEPTSDGTFGGMLPDGKVYNLEVDANHNYFVDDLLVHNCHHLPCKSWSDVLAKIGKCFMVGLSASPCRNDGRGLGNYFGAMVMGLNIRQLVAQGFLSPFRTFVPAQVDTSGLHVRGGDYVTAEAEALVDTPSITGCAVSEYRKLCHDKRAIVFCTSIQHSKHVAEQFRAAGYAAVHIDGTTDDHLRDMAIDDFERGAIRVLCNVDLCGEGLSINAIECVILLRPTQSLGLYIQQVGRGLRTWPGKECLTILDHVGNTMKFGFIDEPREWTLEGDADKRKKKPAPGIRVCPKCFAASPARATVCVECGTPFEVKPRQNVEEREGELIELTAEQIAKKRERMAQGQATTLAQLENIARITGKKPGWAMHVMAGREAKKRRQA
jgi:DNA repair protein RadD